jgi:hypothetical protein
LAQSIAAAAVDWAWPAQQRTPLQFLKHTLATHLLTLRNERGRKAEMEASSAGKMVGLRAF